METDLEEITRRVFIDLLGFLHAGTLSEDLKQRESCRSLLAFGLDPDALPEPANLTRNEVDVLLKLPLTKRVNVQVVRPVRK